MPEVDVKSTDPPAQKVVAPEAEMVGAAGNGFTVTDTLALVEELHPFASVTVTSNVPEVVTVIACVVAPVDHK